MPYIFKKLKHAPWVGESYLKVKYDLGYSGVRFVTREFLSLDIDKMLVSAKEGDPYPQLISLISQRYNVPEQKILLTNGATMAMFIAYSVLLERGNQILLEVPNYEPLYFIPHAFGAQVKILERSFDREFQIDLEEMERKMTRDIKLISITNLHNPSGVGTIYDKMQTVGQIARDYGAYLLCNEVYLDGVLQPQNFKPAATLGDRMVSINSLSKIYGTPDLRAGWIIAPEDFIQKARTIMDYLAGFLSFPGISLATQVLKNGDRICQRVRELAEKNINIISEWVNQQEGIEWVKPAGGTVCIIKLPRGVESREFANLLKEKYDTLVVPGDFFWYKGYVRVSFGCDEQILKEGLARISDALKQIKSATP